MDATALTIVFVAALITALATGLGALPLLAMRNSGRRAQAIGTALAAGLMLAASFSLIKEGFALDPLRTVYGLLLGLSLIWLTRRALPDAALHDPAAQDRRKVFLIMAVMTAHSAAEGIGVGVAWGGGAQLGEFITIAIALHNVPEGLAIALVMVPRGASVGKAALFAIASSLPQPLLAVPAFLFVTVFNPWLPIGLGLAAGAMLWMIFSELLPDAGKAVESGALGVLVTASFVAMLALTLLLG
ncbi:MAG: ZIP family metal transporter [Pararhodobacter sp.]